MVDNILNDLQLIVANTRDNITISLQMLLHFYGRQYCRQYHFFAVANTIDNIKISLQILLQFHCWQYCRQYYNLITDYIVG